MEKPTDITEASESDAAAATGGTAERAMPPEEHEGREGLEAANPGRASESDAAAATGGTAEVPKKPEETPAPEEGEGAEQGQPADEPTTAPYPPAPSGPKHAKPAEPAPARSRGRRVRNAILYALLGVLVLAAAILVGSNIWAQHTWESLAADEVFYHTRVSLGGTDPTMLPNYLRTYGVAELAACAAVATVLVALRKRKRALHVATALVAVCAVAAGGWAIHDFDTRTGTFTYMSGLETPDADEPDFIQEHNVDPAGVELAFPEQKRNLIYIYLESMEMTYADRESGGAFERSMIPELVALAQDEGEDFSGGNEGEGGAAIATGATTGAAATDAATAAATDAVSQINGALALPGCTWTMGGMFAQTSGLPLKLPLSGGAMQDASDFFPSITALGDILAKQGYSQQLLIGSDAVFGGRDLYFTQHGGYALHDYYWAQRQGLIPADYYEFWGFEDRKLFEFARQQATELAAVGEPFNLTLLTVDTHFNDGYRCPLCGWEFGDNQYANAIACSSRQVADFVHWAQQQPWAADTTIVLCGDHTTMAADFCADVPEDYTRRTYTCILNSAVEPASAGRREYSTLDLFPTTLAALGVDVSGGRLGLGVDLFGTEPTLVEALGLEACREGLGRQSAFMDGLSDVHITADAMRAAAQTATLDAWATGWNRRAGIRFVLNHAFQLNSENVLGARLDVTDTRTGVTASHPLAVVQNPNDPNVFTCEAVLPGTSDDLPYLAARAYLTVDGFENYPVAAMEAFTQVQEETAYEGEDPSEGEAMGEGANEEGAGEGAGEGGAMAAEAGAGR